MSSLLLAVDLGSSFLKVAAFDGEGRVVGRESRAYATRRPGPGLAEQDPDAWIELLVQATNDLWRGGLEPERIVGIGLSARGALAIFVDENGAVLAPCWLDKRHGDAARALAATLGDDLDYQTRYLASKTFHLRRAHPAAFERLAHPLFAKDFMLYRLTGALATDPSSGPPNGVWPTRLWDAVGVPVGRLAPVRPHVAIGGALTAKLAERLGLPAGLPIGVGGHDGACANLGVGAVRSGDVCLTMGTQGVVRAIADPPPPNARARRVSPYHFLPGRWCCSGDLVLAGAAPTLVARLLTGAGDSPSEVARMHHELGRAASESPPGSSGVTYLPFPGGLVSPELRPNARAAFLGMSSETRRADLYRAALEGVSCAFRSVVERQREVGLRHAEFRLSGGGAQSALWTQILADVLNVPLTVVEPEEGPRGAAMLLAVGLGWFGSPEEAVAAWVRPTRRVEPSMATTAYEKVYHRYRRLAEAVYAAELDLSA